MIRRGFWLVVGATGGIIGYRRVTALGRQLSQTLSPQAKAPLPDGADRAGNAGRPDNATPAGNADRAANAAAAGNPDRASAAHNRQAPGRPPLDRKALTRRARRGLIRGAIRFSRDARRFSRDARRFGRDVREGMDLYMVRHAPQGSPNLDPGAQSRRPPARPLTGALGATTDIDDRVKDDR